MPNEFAAYDYPVFVPRFIEWGDRDFEDVLIDLGYETQPSLSLGVEFMFRMNVYYPSDSYQPEGRGNKFIVEVQIGQRIEILFVDDLKGLLTLIKEYTPTAQLTLDQARYNEEEGARELAARFSQDRI